MPLFLTLSPPRYLYILIKILLLTKRLTITLSFNSMFLVYIIYV